MKKIISIAACLIILGMQIVIAQNTSANSLQIVFNDYINLKNALTMDNGDSTRVAAKFLFNDINKVNTESLTADQKKSWSQYNEKIRYDAEHMKGTSEIEHQREHFVSLSSNMFKLMKSVNVNSADIYYQFCPMANDGKGAYWLSEKSQIANPYLGKSMPTCGSTKETIKAK